MHNHNILINDIAPEGSICDVCGSFAEWQMYCKDCGEILSFYCDDHAYLSQGDKKLEKHVKKAYRGIEPLRMENENKKAQEEWQEFRNKRSK